MKPSEEKPVWQVKSGPNGLIIRLVVAATGSKQNWERAVRCYWEKRGLRAVCESCSKYTLLNKRWGVYIAAPRHHVAPRSQESPFRFFQACLSVASLTLLWGPEGIGFLRKESGSQKYLHSGKEDTYYQDGSPRVNQSSKNESIDGIIPLSLK